MKYINLYENIENYIKPKYWLLDYYIKDNHSHSYSLYPDEESVQNAIITIINDERGEFEEEWNDEMYFTNYDDAIDWYEKTFSDIKIIYHKVALKDHFDGGPDLKRMRDIRKYNL